MIYTITLNPALDRSFSAATVEVGTVNRITPVRDDPGGKGINVAQVLKALDKPVCSCLIIGGSIGLSIASMLDKEGIPTIIGEVKANTRSNVKITGSDGVTTEFNEAGPAFVSDAYEAMESELFERIEEGDICVISGSVPPGAPEDIYADLITALKEKGCRTFLDTSGVCLAKGLEAGPYFAKPNAAEAGIGESIEEAIGIADTYIAKGINSIIITLGSYGAVYRDAEGRLMTCAGVKVTPVCTTGCGDAVTAGFASGIYSGLEPAEAFRFAIACGTAAAVTDGTQAPSPETIEKYLQEVRINILS